ncbi:MAG: heavy metal-binding domain-containing protein [Verrucomicrobiota bacterium]
MEEPSPEVYTVLLVYAFPVIIALGALVIGRTLELRHFRSIRVRETATNHYPAVPTSTWDPEAHVVGSRLVSSSVVVSLDHFKRILANLRNIFGGNVRSYESLLDRGKREAILRLKEQSPDCHIIVNLRIVTSNIASVHDRRNDVGGVEILAFGTAVRYADDPHSSVGNSP